MESSFFEYRDKTGAGSDSDSEFIDNSLLAEESFTPGKKPAVKNQTVFVAESADSDTDDETEEDEPSGPKFPLRKGSTSEPHIISSSEDDASRRDSIRRSSQSKMSATNVELSSSEDEASPEMIPKRRPPTRPKSSESDTSIIGRKKNKRMMFLDSDTENSIIIEHDKHKKMTCLKDTPLKIDSDRSNLCKKLHNVSIMDQSEDSDESDDENDKSDDAKDDSADEKAQTDDDGDSEEETNQSRNLDDNKTKQTKATDAAVQNDSKSEDENVQSDDNDESEAAEHSDDDGPDEDQMVMSRATRMSIMGIIPKGDDESDDSDFIQSDEKSNDSSNLSAPSPLPDMSTDIHTPQKEDKDSSTISCSPFMSPLHDVTNEALVDHSYDNKHKQKDLKERVLSKVMAAKSVKADDDDVTFISTSFVNSVKSSNKENERKIDDDVTIIDTKPEIIALSSDDEDDVSIFF